MKQLHHQTSKALERPGDADRRGDLDQDTLRSLYIDLQLAGLVDR